MVPAIAAMESESRPSVHRTEHALGVVAATGDQQTECDGEFLDRFSSAWDAGVPSGTYSYVSPTVSQGLIARRRSPRWLRHPSNFVATSTM